MLLACASAPDRLFLLELFFDAALPGTALLAHEFASSSLVVVQPRPRELQVPFLATFDAGVRLDVSRAEAPGSASHAICMHFVPLGITQHVFVELVPGEYLLTSVAAAGIRLALALDALFRVAFEVFGDLLHAAPGASMAR